MNRFRITTLFFMLVLIILFTCCTENSTRETEISPNNHANIEDVIYHDALSEEVTYEEIPNEIGKINRGMGFVRSEDLGSDQLNTNFPPRQGDTEASTGDLADDRPSPRKLRTRIAHAFPSWTVNTSSPRRPSGVK